MACEICKKPYIAITDNRFFDFDEKPHVCNSCGKRFSLKIQLKRHLLIHEGDAPYICHECEKHVDETSSYNLRLSKKGNFSCETCNLCFPTKRLLLRHSSEHTMESALQCDECGESFKNITSLKKHAASHKPKKSSFKSNYRKESKYVCQECGKRFSQQLRYVSHCLTHKKYKCDTCNVYFASNKLLDDHRECGSCHSEILNKCSPENFTEKVDSDDKKHICGICEKSFTRKSALEGHVLCHYEENRESAVEDDSDKDVDFQCNYKEKNCEQSKRLCLPKLKIRRSFPCEKCDFICASKKSFDKHIKSHETNPIHTERKSYTCRICSESFDSKETYKKHKLTHGKKEFEHAVKEKEQKVYTCQTCLKTFFKKRHLRKHLRIHLENTDTNQNNFPCSERKKHKRSKKFSCSFCGKLFAGETCLKKHEARHSDDKDDSFNKGKKGKKPKTLICEFCNEDFTGRRPIYVKHKLTHTPEVCGICDARFTDRASLREHCRIHIGTEEGRRFLECSQKALDAKNGAVSSAEPKVEYIYLVLR